VRKRRPESDLEEVVIAIDSNLEQVADRNIAVARVRAAVEHLPAEQRSLLDMAFFQGLTHSEIAAKTGEPLGTVKTRIRAGLLALRRVLA
jgi:RNA polymerase sigma-70 factor (ECF subfamily)